MLFATPTKRAGGLLLAGDFLDLREFNSAIHEIRPEISDKGAEGLVLGLAYEMRKAKEGSRERVRALGATSEGVEYFAAKVPLLRAVMQAVILRGYLRAYGTSRAIMAKKQEAVAMSRGIKESLKKSGKEDVAAMVKPQESKLSVAHRAVLLQFEGALVEGLELAGFQSPETFLDAVDRAVQKWGTEPSAPLCDALDHQFLFGVTTKRARLDFLGALPDLISPDSDYWRQLRKDIHAAAHRDGVPVEQIEFTWPDKDPKW